MSEPFHNPFGALAGRGTPPGDAEAPKPAAPAGAAPPGHLIKIKVARAVVRFEKSGRGGKQVTVVEQLGLKPAELAEWLTALKAELGCGGKVEGDAVMLQGDHRKRLPAWLQARGVKRITVS